MATHFVWKFHVSESMEHIILACEIESYVERLEISNLEDIGTKKWFEFHKKLILLNQQSVQEIISLQEENVKEWFVTLRKISVLIHEAIQIDIWKDKVLPYFLESSQEFKNTLILYSIFYHENIVVSILENVLFHSESAATMDESVIDLVDYAVKNITALLTIVQAEPDQNVKLNNIQLDEILKKKRELEFDIGMRCISIIRYLAEYLDTLPLCVFSRILITHDVPYLLVQLIENKPWSKENVKGEKMIYEGHWQNLEANDETKICKIEGQVWFGLLQLFLNPKFSTYYKITDFHLQQFLKLQKYLHDDMLDQIPPLANLNHWLSYLPIYSPSLPRVSCSPVNIEIVPQVKSSILNKYHKKWKKLAKYQAKCIFTAEIEYIKNVAQILNDVYNLDKVYYTEDKKCFICKKQAGYRCSECKAAWYCNRKCQVKGWEYHKTFCSKTAAASGNRS